jgi:(4-(4-[2-(gamma-L-glutamylamino)ethyl]phenoxymethyl)furan-2-yl)methanamine synthase
MLTVGWDIGGVNTKAALVVGGTVRAVRVRPYELQRDPPSLAPLLRELIDELGVSAADAAHAVTMTAELSQMFRTKREGVSFVLDAVVTAFDASRVRVLTVSGGFVDVAEARRRPLDVAAANWAATARQVARSHRHAVLVDIGTTSTDIIPIVDGVVSAAGLTDPDRLLSGELIYTGALRTPVEAIVDAVPYRDGLATVSAESFALAGDVYVWRGDLAPDDYTWPTPDGRPATRAFAGERLARVVCADREMLDQPAVSAIAEAIAQAQIARVAAGLERVCERHRALRTAVVTGLGAFIGAAAARAAGLDVIWLAQALGEDAARCAPAASVALLLAAEPLVASRAEASAFDKATADKSASEDASASAIDIVIKIGGGLLADTGALDAVLSAIASAGLGRQVLIVPGGGPFADTVREVDQRLPLADEAAHWMAILAMDQYAHLLASRLDRASLVHDRRAIGRALAADRVPVLAPSTWLRDRDPLPHSWDVTSDSIAAWMAGEVGASTVVLVKPAGAAGPDLVDGYFDRALRPGIAVELVTADQLDRLRAMVSGAGSGAASAEAAARS